MNICVDQVIADTESAVDVDNMVTSQKIQKPKMSLFELRLQNHFVVIVNIIMSLILLLFVNCASVIFLTVSNLSVFS